MTVNWGILATGRIAHTFAAAVLESEGATLTAVASRTTDSAETFAKQHGEVKAHGTYQALLEDAEVQAIYIATPHPQHAEWTIKALRHGKAVFAEKPIGLNHAEVMAMVETARREQQFLMEAFMYRTHVQTDRVMELIRDGAIGEVRHVRAAHGFTAPFDASSRLYANDLAGGAIMDVGCYPLSYVRLVYGEEPQALHGHAHIGATGVDHWAAALLEFSGGRSAQIATGVALTLDNRVEVFGSDGRIVVPYPWSCADAEGRWSIDLIRGAETETFDGESKLRFVCEVEAASRAIEQGQLESSAMTWNDSLGQAKTLDAWREAVGLRFDIETPARAVHTVDREPLETRAEAPMRRAQFVASEKPVSRLVMGCDNQPNYAHAAVMFDDFYRAGGNAFDTAHIYGGGRMESLLGHWVANRGIRDELFVIGKGAHTPQNFPDQVAPQLSTSLQRLQTNYLDLYFLHRDNADIAVDQWIDVLNRECDADRIRAFGASNWSRERIETANEYAAKTGLIPFTAVSNNFSLAQMIEPVWAGCVAASEFGFCAFLQSQQLALFSWSSQARGFFTPRADAIRDAGNSGIDTKQFNQPTDDEMRRCWFSEENFERRRRASTLAEQRGVELINVALAYVLHQPFPCFPLVGPRQLSETQSCLQALDIELSTEELAWLNLEQKH